MSAKKSKKTKNSKAKKQRKKESGFLQNQGSLIPLLIALAVTLIVFLPSIPNDFVNWDDDVNIIDNVNLSELSFENVKKIFHYKTGNVIGNYNPLTILTFAIEKHFVGLDATLFHINNLILHLICVFLVFRIMLLLKLNPISAMIVALLFGIHPMRVESVAWVTERKDVLFGAFYFAAIYQYLLYHKEKGQNNKRYWWIIGFFILSLLSKIQAVSLPLSLLAIDYYLKRPLNSKLITEKIPHFLLSLFFGGLGIYLLKEFGSLEDNVTNFGFVDRLFIGAYSFTIYLIKLVIPYEMLPLYPYPKSLSGAFYAAPAVVALAFAGAWWAFKKEHRTLFFGFSFFFVNVVFMLQILGAGQGFIADRFTYIPYLGFFFIVGFLYQKLMEERPQVKAYLPFMVGIYLLGCAYLSAQQCKIWKNGETLWTHVIENGNNIASLAYGNRAYFRRGQGQSQAAIKDYQLAIQANPAKAAPYNSLGKTYFDLGQIQPALENYGKAIERDDSQVEFHVNQGAAYGAAGQIQKAIESLNKAEATDPEFDNLYLNRSLAYNNIREYGLALKDINKYLDLKPKDASMWFEKAVTHRNLGGINEAIQAFNKAIGLDSKVAAFYLERGKTYLGSNNRPQGVQDIRQAQSMGLKIDPSLLQQIQ